MLHDAALLSPAMAAASPRIAGVLLVAAGAYQLSRFKRACLTHCQTPMGFLMSHWRDGAGGALAMGFRHGLYCLGCCWALMGVLFAVGVMNLAWVGALTVFILLERIGPLGTRVARAGGVLLVGLGMLAVAGWPR
jgi:predicted metal-binding membrane protein